MPTIASARQEGQAALNLGASQLPPTGGSVEVVQTMQIDVTNAKTNSTANAKTVSIDIKVFPNIYTLPSSKNSPITVLPPTDRGDGPDGGSSTAFYNSSFFKQFQQAAKDAGAAEPIAIDFSAKQDLRNTRFREHPLERLFEKMRNSKVVVANTLGQINLIAALQKQYGPQLQLESLVVPDHLLIPMALKPFAVTVSELQERAAAKQAIAAKNEELEAEFQRSLRSIVTQPDIAALEASLNATQDNKHTLQEANPFGPGYVTWESNNIPRVEPRLERFLPTQALPNANQISTTANEFTQSIPNGLKPASNEFYTAIDKIFKEQQAQQLTQEIQIPINTAATTKQEIAAPTATNTATERVIQSGQALSNSAAESAAQLNAALERFDPEAKSLANFSITRTPSAATTTPEPLTIRMPGSQPIQLSGKNLLGTPLSALITPEVLGLKYPETQKQNQAQELTPQQQLEKLAAQLKPANALLIPVEIKAVNSTLSQNTTPETSEEQQHPLSTKNIRDSLARKGLRIEELRNSALKIIIENIASDQPQLPQSEVSSRLQEAARRATKAAKIQIAKQNITPNAQLAA